MYLAIKVSSLYLLNIKVVQSCSISLKWKPYIKVPTDIIWNDKNKLGRFWCELY